MTNVRITRALARVLGIAVLAAPFLSLGFATAAHAQFGPPMSVFGSISDSEGVIPEGLAVEAYVGNTLCGKGKTQFTGDGDGRVTVYFANVVSREQTSGCGENGSDVRIKVGDRFADGSVKWEAGPKRFDIVFNNATPAPIPTFTPTPPRTTATTAPAVTPTPPASNETATSAASTTETGTATVTGTPSASATATATASATPTLRGGVTSNTSPGGGGDSGDSGFPVWGGVVAALGGLALIGGGVGYMMARSRHEDDESDPAVPGA
jgi:hypothetical protein